MPPPPPHLPLYPLTDLRSSALPILRQLGAQQSTSIFKSGGGFSAGNLDLSMVKVWAGLEARKFLQASVESVEVCVKSDLLSPNI